MGINFQEFMKKYCTTEAGLGKVEIRIHAESHITLLINEHLTTRLFSLKQENIVKTIIDKKDVIILLPMRGITVQELYVDVNRLVFGGVTA